MSRCLCRFYQISIKYQSSIKGVFLYRYHQTLRSSSRSRIWSENVTGAASLSSSTSTNSSFSSPLGVGTLQINTSLIFQINTIFLFQIDTSLLLKECFDTGIIKLGAPPPNRGAGARMPRARDLRPDRLQHTSIKLLSVFFSTSISLLFNFYQSSIKF